jgi:hypothetical protein
MPKSALCSVVAAVLCLAAPPALVAQELVFVGTSLAGSTDPHWFIQSSSGAIASRANTSFTDNVTGAVWTDQGLNLYCSRSLGNSISRGQWSPSGPTWSTFYTALGPCYGVGSDPHRRRLWTLTQPGGGPGRELVCLDADPVSAGFGSVVAQTSILGSVTRERWALSPSGNYAAVPHTFLQSGLFEVVDTNPNSPNFLQVIASSIVPGASTGFSFASDCVFSPDELFAYVLYTGIGINGLAVMFLPTGAWVDFDPLTPGDQDLALPKTVPNRMAISPGGEFLVVSGQGSGGWAVRIDLNPFAPQNTQITEYLQGQSLLPNCNAASLSPDGRTVAVSTTPVNQQSPSYLMLLDAASGNLLRQVTLTGGWNVYTTAWQDFRPLAEVQLFGSGCPGSLGAPGLGPAPASALPQLGRGFALEFANLPQGLGVLVTGFSAVSSGSLPLPAPLAPFGMPGCTLYVEALATQLLLGAGSAFWQLQVPLASGLAGLDLYVQGFALDAAANAAGLTVSNAVRARLGR